MQIATISWDFRTHVLIESHANANCYSELPLPNFPFEEVREIDEVVCLALKVKSPLLAVALSSHRSKETPA